jgi:hypothetical protein
MFLIPAGRALYPDLLRNFTPFTAATALGAGLLFLIEPMTAKGLLPWLGGTPAVWTVSLVFFQTTLLAGYLYAHLLTSRLPLHRTVVIHGVLAAIAVVLILLRGTAPTGPVQGPPALWLLGALASSVGLPFFVLAATAPLMGRWVAALPGERDPYPLYAVGNASSLLALLAYPLLVERALPLASFAGTATGGLTQNALWSALFVVFAAIIGLCGFQVARQSAAPARLMRQETGATPGSTWQWMFLSAIPAAAMLGTTQALTTDVAAVPLLWVVPLALYLLTFVLAFARPHWLPPRILSWALAALVLVVAATQWLSSRPAPRLALPLYLATLFAAGALCHGRLARSRPPARELTGFYLAIAAGGALGSMVCGLLAPLVLRSVAEYPAALVLACLCRPGGRIGLRRDVVPALAFIAVVATVHWMLTPSNPMAARSLQVEVPLISLALAVLAFRPWPFATGLAVMFFMAATTGPNAGHDVLTTRSFFGVLRVKNTPGMPFVTGDGQDRAPTRLPMHELYHGTTLHGIQIRTGNQLQRLPTSYFHPQGPLGRVFAGLRARPGRPQLAEVGVVGLGAGTLAAYGQAGERFTFFEIDPKVAQIARDPELFSFLEDSPARTEIVVADGRIALAAQPDGRFDLLVMDAFSSDAPPVHLLTHEALALVLRKLRPGGVAAYNVTGTYFDLAPVLAEGVAALGDLAGGLYWSDDSHLPAGLALGKAPSCWVVVAADRAYLEAIRGTGPWAPLSSQRRTGGRRWLWTDRSSSPLAALR